MQVELIHLSSVILFPLGIKCILSQKKTSNPRSWPNNDQFSRLKVKQESDKEGEANREHDSQIPFALVFISCSILKFFQRLFRILYIVTLFEVKLKKNKSLLVCSTSTFVSPPVDFDHYV
ncbi:hypothetical protein TNIN_439931 [Trichonephila inaurata madagascariensis]|uniref:Uncharacterized protein n=1 Tax=Trichonephila inaurata madagascariensis TaxID=2747483 RepID=A0A8X6MCB0_9ARAC|nr:hypothetical protein TNIN_439931 [Trichonephila inaurata madagascariensis]